MSSAGQFRSPRKPHYSLSTVATSAPDYINHEQDVIHQAFHTGNYTWMKELLPVGLHPDSINFLRKKRMDQVKTGGSPRREPLTWAKMTGLWGGGYYYEFEFMPDPYDLKHEVDQGIQKRDKEKQSSVGHTLNWRQPSQEVRLKYEPLVISKEELKNPRAKEVLPFIGGHRSEEELLQKSGPTTLVQQPSFRTGRGQGLNDDGKMSRVGVQSQVIRKLQEKLNEDWDDVTCVVSVTEQDMVQVAFLMSEIDCERGLHAYMSILAKDCELINALGLRKISQLWGVTRTFSKTGQSTNSDESGVTWMFFVLCPKWVRMRSTDAYYTRHPRAQGSQFRMSKAGSSVLLSLGTSQGNSLMFTEKAAEKPKVI